MRIAVLSDIHGNLPALQSVIADIDKWRADRVIVNGDVVNRGPRSLECLEIVLERMSVHGWKATKGNHEEFVLHCAENPPGNSLQENHLRQFTDWTVKQLGDLIEPIKEWPEYIDFESPGGSPGQARHGSIKGSRYGIYPDISEQELNERLPDNCSLFVTSHTHSGFTWVHRNRLILNSGSVGSPFDGNHKASYLRVAWEKGQWQSELVRVEYDTDKARKDFATTGFLEEAGPFSALFLRELILARHLTREWKRYHADSSKSGEGSVGNSIARFLHQFE